MVPDEKAPNLDALRALAVSFVVLSHVYPGRVPASYHLPALGLLGVLIFFVHTSLVLMLSLERQVRRNPGQTFVRFMARRVARIFPLSVTVVLLVTLLTWVLTSKTVPTRTVIANLLLVQNVTGDPSVPAPLWSLPFEIQMYVVLPALFLFVTRLRGRARVPALVALWIAAVAIVLVVAASRHNYHLIKYVPCFLPGVLAFAAWSRPRMLPSTVLFAFVGVVAVIYPVLVHYGLKENLLAWPVCLSLGLLLPHCRALTSDPIKRVAAIVAKYSYGVYLIHQPCADWLLSDERGFLPFLPLSVRFVTFLAATVALSWLAYHAIEEPALRRGSRWIDLVLVGVTAQKSVP